MSRKSKTVLAVTLVLAFLAASGLWLWFTMHRAPQAARLLPEADALIYVNLRPLRVASAFASLPPVSRDADYQAFVDATGFQFERDLDEVAVAVHLPATTLNGTANPASLPETRYSEVFIGRFDLQRLLAYFTKNAKSVEAAGNAQIFVVPVENRTVRVVLLSSHLVMVSNADDGNIIRGMIQQAHTIPIARGPQLLRKHYQDVPPGSLAWALARPGRNLPLPGGLEVPTPPEITWVGSLRYSGSIQLEAQAIAPNEQDARQITESLTGLLALFHSIEVNTQTKGADPDARALFESLQVQQEKNRAVITATVPIGFIKKMANGAVSP